ncbi:DUF7848 domain-containing protein [Streptomyces sp. NPDC002845]
MGAGAFGRHPSHHTYRENITRPYRAWRRA